VNVEFECVVCGETAVATVSDAAAGDEPLETLRDCPNCGIETIWIAA
jgi:predicted RNA-binding Zn-ribbon protein involved in translation (DUF1610 family)